MLGCLFACAVALLAPPVRAEVVAITGATLVDLRNFGRSTHDIRNSVVIVKDGRVTAAGPAATVRVPAGARRIDARGKWLIPGLIDGFSSQLDEGFANANLAMGVTTISQTEDQDDRRGAYAKVARQPNMRRLGGVLGYDISSIKGDLDWGRIHDEGRKLSDAELREEIDAKAKAGFAGLMLMYPLDDHQVAVAAADARRRGLFTVAELGHASYAKAGAAGVHTFVHTSRFELELAPPDLQKAIGQRPFAPPGDPLMQRYGQFLMNLDTASSAFRHYSATLARHRTAIMPTLAISTTYLPETPNPWNSPVGPLIDPAKITRLPFDRETGRAPVPPGAPANYVDLRIKRARKSIETVKAFHAAGVPMLAGSGAVAFGVLPGWGLHRELALFTYAGLAPREALATASENYAALYHWRDVGRIARGYRADLVLLNADPTKTISAAQDIDTIFLGGQQLDRAALLAWRPSKPI